HRAHEQPPSLHRFALRSATLHRRESVHVSDLLQRLTFNQLHHDARLRRRVFKPVNLGDIRVVQTSKDLGFALESGKTIWIISEVIRQKLQSNLTMQLGIKGTKHHTHTAFTER